MSYLRPGPGDHYTCRRTKHKPLLEKINRKNPKCSSMLPSREVMTEFYQGIYPHHMGYEPVNPKTDKRFGWPISTLLRNCQNRYPSNRPSTQEILKFLRDNSSSPSSPLYSYRDILNVELDAPRRFCFEDVRIEDVDIEPGFPEPPSHLQSNLGQIK